MNKNDFLLALSDRLSFLPREEAEDRRLYYSEMIDDRMEEGLTEQAAVAELGSVDEVADQILSDIPLAALIRERLRNQDSAMPEKSTGPKKEKKPRRPWQTALLILGSPLWLSLLIAGAAVIVALAVTLWSLIVSLWAVFVSLAASAAGSTVAAAVTALRHNPVTALAFLGAALVCAGLAVFLFFGASAASRGSALLTKKLVCGLGRRRRKKEAFQ